MKILAGAWVSIPGRRASPPDGDGVKSLGLTWAPTLSPQVKLKNRDVTSQQDFAGVGVLLSSSVSVAHLVSTLLEFSFQASHPPSQNSSTWPLSH